MLELLVLPKERESVVPQVTIHHVRREGLRMFGEPLGRPPTKGGPDEPLLGHIPGRATEHRGTEKGIDVPDHTESETARTDAATKKVTEHVAIRQRAVEIENRDRGPSDLGWLPGHALSLGGL